MTVVLPPNPQNDGLAVAEVGAWAEDKYKLVFLYNRLFSTGMKNRWNARVYIDLYSGPGVVHVRDTRRFMWGSPLLALQVADPFDKYIFCEKNPQYIAALKERVRRLAPDANVSYVEGDCNDRVGQVSQLIPRASKSYKVLSFCFVDPFNVSIKFSTIRAIAEGFVDFLILLALEMDAVRNEVHYTSPENRTLDEFLGQSEWRGRWSKHATGVTFPQFLAEEYAKQMEQLRYIPMPVYKMKKVGWDENHTLYRLALFSRNRLAHTYWSEVLKYGTSQQFLPGME